MNYQNQPRWTAPQYSTNTYILNAESEDLRVTTGGYLMASTGRNWSHDSSMSSSSNFNSWPSPCTPNSLESGSPSRSERYSPYSTSIRTEMEVSSKYHQGSLSMIPSTNVKVTFSSLGWTMISEFLKLYEFVVRQNGKERYFVLLTGLKVTPETPQRVDLDEDPCEDKHVRRCMYPGGCQACFTRVADLDRHYQNVHASEGHRRKFYCDYPKCGRSIRGSTSVSSGGSCGGSSGGSVVADDPFTRKDHYRDHLRDYHQEDIGAAKGRNSKTKSTEVWEAEQKQWLKERKTSPHHWRCIKCLDRVYVAIYGWDCPRCNLSCDEDRINTRRAKNPLVKVESDTRMSASCFSPPYTVACNICNGEGWVIGPFGSVVDCTCCLSSVAFQNDNSYGIDNSWT